MIKVLIPSMPTADELLPFLREIDATRHYVKGGPLVRRLEVELSALTRSPCTVVSNGTVSLELALRAMDLPRGSGVLVPAVTFVASAQAIVNAGLQPVICDVAPDTWQLDAEMARSICAHALPGAISAVMPVAAFGRDVPIAPWEAFAASTGLRVLIDAAGAIYDQCSSTNPAIVISYSLNATKALGAGEGGVVATSDLRLGEHVASLANFGPGGTNARMSEYHAAVALASLNIAPDWRGQLGMRYFARLPERTRGGLFGGEQSRRTLLCVALPRNRSAESVGMALAHDGIETKAWYRPYLDERDEFLQCPKYGPMPNTEMLRQRLLGLPYHAFLTEGDVDFVCKKLEEAIA